MATTTRARTESAAAPATSAAAPETTAAAETSAEATTAAETTAAETTAEGTTAEETTAAETTAEETTAAETTAVETLPTEAGVSAECMKGQAPTKKDGVLTVGTDKPAFPPYIIDDDPTNGKGFESAVAYAVAKAMGFEQADVKWMVVPFNSSYAPGEKKFDFDINQVSISEKRLRAVDFSQPYYTTPQAVVTNAESPAATPRAWPTSRTRSSASRSAPPASTRRPRPIQPSKDPRVYDTSNDVVAALKNGQVDAIVVDLPTAFYLASVEIENGKIVGQFSARARPVGPAAAEGLGADDLPRPGPHGADQLGRAAGHHGPVDRRGRRADAGVAPRKRSSPGGRFERPRSGARLDVALASRPSRPPWS